MLEEVTVMITLIAMLLNEFFSSGILDLSRSFTQPHNSRNVTFAAAELALFGLTTELLVFALMTH